MAKLISFILVLSLLLCGCSKEWWEGDGRGDWILNLCEGYYLSKLNSRTICLVHKEYPEQPGSSFVIPRYFVTAYQVCDSFILLNGIPTDELAISDEERNGETTCYYIVNMKEQETYGPFKTQNDFLIECETLGIAAEITWIEIDSRSSQPPIA